MDKKIEKLMDKLRKAADELEMEMKKKWPIDSTIEVRLNSRQIYPTAMKVVGYHPHDSSVRASMPSRTSQYGTYVRDIYYKYIVSP